MHECLYAQKILPDRCIKKKNGPSKVGRQVAGYHDRGRPAFHCPPFKNLLVMYHIYIYIAYSKINSIQ